MKFVLLTLLAYFPEITNYEEERFPENPVHDEDEDRISDAEDCDDANPAMPTNVEYFDSILILISGKLQKME